MKNKYGIIITICVLALFTTSSALGSYLSDLQNLSDHNEHLEKDTLSEEAIEAGICDCIIESNMSSVKSSIVPTETTLQASIPVSIPQPAPGIGIVEVLVALSAIYIIKKKW
jgi:hypothetical protein